MWICGSDEAQRNPKAVRGQDLGFVALHPGYSCYGIAKSDDFKQLVFFLTQFHYIEAVE